MSPARGMSPERWRDVEALFYAALERAPEERSAFLAEACGVNAALRHEVEVLLAADADAGDFLEPRAARAPTKPDPAGPLQAALAGRYVIERELGRGGMATVYLAEDTRHHRLVALKVLRPDFGATLGAERFLREIEIAARFQHPHILPLHDSGEAEGLLYYVTPFVRGESLRARLKREGQLPIDEAVCLATQVASALDYAHRHNVLHRDIKPENILLDENGYVLVADFGIARSLQRTADWDTLTSKGLLVGTPAYMSPEQAAGEREIDARSDVYSLGCVLYEMLAGEAPFTGATPQAIIAKRFAGPPLDVRVLRPAVPRGVGDAVMRALAVAPVDRFATAGEFAAALIVNRSTTAASTVAPRFSLPSVPTPLIGRERETRDVLQLLESCRLVTLLGPGGVGKTRLAVQVAKEEAGTYRDGIYFVPLAAVSSRELLAPSIAESLGLTFADGRDPKAQLLGYLCEKQLLLVLDNFEQLVDEALFLSELLEHAPGVRLLVTSRERLNVAQETIYELSGLALPEGYDKAPADEGAAKSAAVQLFVERARRGDPAFTLSEETRPLVIEICRLVGGLPLAIELAAPMLRVLSCRELADELGRNVDFLATSMRDVPTRHRSLRAVFESSWALLSEPERTVLTRLAVFRGGFRRDAAERVARATLQTLLALTNKSLVQRTASGRYEIHEVIRQYAEEKLRETPGEPARTEDARSEYFANFLRAREERLKGNDQRAALDEVAEEIENIRAGWNWAIEHGGDSAVEACLPSLVFFYVARSWSQEGEAALGFVERSEARTVLVAKALSARAMFSLDLGRREKARAQLGRSLAILRGLGAEAEMARPLRMLGFIALSIGKDRAAQRLLRTAVRICRATKNRHELAGCLNVLADVMANLGSLDEAETLFRESIAIRRALGDQLGLASTFNNFASLLHARGRLADALRTRQESLELAERLHSPILTASAIGNMAELHVDLGQYEEARALAEQSLARFRHLGVQEGIASRLLTLGEIAAATGDAAMALKHFREAMVLASAAHIPNLALDILISYATVLPRTGEPERARELLSLAERHRATRERQRRKARELLQQLGSTPAAEDAQPRHARALDEQLKKAIESLLELRDR